MRKQISVRRIQAQKMQARSILLRLLDRMSGFAPESELRHFAKVFKREASGIAKIDLKKLTAGYPLEHQLVDRIQAEFAQAAFRILQATARNEPAPQADLDDAVCLALNQEVLSISIVSDEKRARFLA